MNRLFTFVMICVCSVSYAQSNASVADLISASQAEGAHAQLFEITPNRIDNINIKDYSESREFNVRRGVPNFIRKCNSGQGVRVAFIGGSITKANDQYRTQVANYISSMFPNVEMLGINAGVGGTGSDLGACRLHRHVLRYDPDIVFVEFAVNGANAPGVEGIVRQIIKYNPNIDICMIYTIYRGQSKVYGDGDIPSNIERLEKIAEYYNLPSVHMGMWAGVLEREGKLIWAAPASHKGDEIIFSRDGVHPIKTGGDYYASAVARTFEEMKDESGDIKFSLPEPLLADNMESAQYIDPSRFINRSGGWNIVKVSDDADLAIYAGWFDNIFTADRDSAPIKFRFEGDMLGIYDIGAPDTGAYDIFLNGQKIVASKFDHNGKIRGYEFVDIDDPRPSMVRFNKFCFQPRPQYEVIELKYGIYDVEIKAHSAEIDKVATLSTGKKAKDGKSSVQVDESGNLPSEYKPQRVHLGWIMINGNILK